MADDGKRPDNVGQQFDTWYHGTQPGRLDYIHQNGLSTPPGAIHPAKWFMLTDSHEQAASYAQPGGKVLEYHIPHDLTDYHHPEALLWPAHPHSVYGQDARAVAPKRPIPARYIAAEHDVGEDEGGR